MGAERKLLMLGRSSFALAPGSTKTIAVKLSRSVRSKLEQIGRRRISVRLTVRTRSESTRRRLTLRLPSVKSAGSASSSAPPAD